LELASLLDARPRRTIAAISLKRDAAHLIIEAADLASLREQHARLNELQIRQGAVATRLRFELDAGARIQAGW
jgi:hypothetical protein